MPTRRPTAISALGFEFNTTQVHGVYSLAGRMSRVLSWFRYAGQGLTDGWQS
jgi:hypothetical protein